MSPLPKQFIDRWRDGYGATDPGSGTLYWHILLGDNDQLRRAVQNAQKRITTFPGLHMTPLHWLHLTVLIAGPADRISNHARSEMLEVAKSSLAEAEPITITLSRIIYHPEAIVLAAEPAEALSPMREAAQRATQAVTGHNGTDEGSSLEWTPHVTLCYSTSVQPAPPIIAALGKQLPACQVPVDTLSLVLQRRAEWLWDWSPVGAASLAGPLLARLRNRGTLCTPPAVDNRLGSGPPWRFALFREAGAQ